ncbi:putative selenate ABC transporter substrate-binding protein [Litoribacillus peritrichatus]|uniref:Selenate ABC transporter substrate-binding protein n=1 Tax=Litoribacillus peritrichatus TaxID=718191 RepID=A0ABP7M4U0_9GAMM
MRLISQFILASGLLLSALFTTTANAKETFTFTAIPDQDETQLKERFGKIATYLSEKTGIEVNYIPVKSYSAAVTAFRNNQVQLAWFGGLSGVKARNLVPDSKAIAQGYEDQFFVTYFIAHQSTGLQSSEAFPQTIAGKRFTFGSKGSTSGRLMPEFYIREHLKKAPNTAFSEVGFSGDHSRTIALVQAGSYEVGAVNFKVWEKELSQGKIDTNKVKVIWQTPTYPDYQWTIRGDVDTEYGQGLTAKITEALLNMTDKALLDSFPRTKFVPASNEDYAPIKTTAQSIGLMD